MISTSGGFFVLTLALCFLSGVVTILSQKKLNLASICDSFKWDVVNWTSLIVFTLSLSLILVIFMLDSVFGVAL